MTDSPSSQQGCDPNCDQVVNNIQDMLQTAPYLLPCGDCCCIHKIKEKGYTKMTDSSSSQQGCDNKVVLDIGGMLRTAPSLLPSSHYCIHKVPVNLRKVNGAAYTPQIISIGPLHRENKKLKPMQAYKIGFLNNLLRRKPSIKLEDYVKTLRRLEKQVRNSYFDQELICKISSDDFVKMMLLDGCFVVELFTSLRGEQMCDPYWAIVRLDLTLFENQLPYFLLEQLFNFIKCNNPCCQPDSFFDLTARYFRYFLNVENDEDIDRLKNYQLKHFLDLILKCQSSSGLTGSVKDNTADRKPIYLPSATELHESGVEFKKGESDCFLDIKFNNGVLEIPALTVEDYTEHMFRNMIAMEECSVGNTAYITHYIILLDFLISTPKDVALLRRKRIINNYLGSDDEVAEMINKLGITGVIASTADSPYYEHLKNMDIFYNKRRHRWKATLKRNYFHNPWTVLSLIAAIVLLICTIAQTVFSFISILQ